VHQLWLKRNPLHADGAGLVCDWGAGEISVVAGLSCWQMVLLWLNTQARPHIIHAAIESHFESLGFGQLWFAPWQPWHSFA
jgi:hypothetical protein